MDTEKKNRNNFRDLLTRAEAADYLGVQPHTLAVWACNKRYNLKMVKFGRTVRYRLSDLDDFLAQHVA